MKRSRSPIGPRCELVRSLGFFVYLPTCQQERSTRRFDLDWLESNVGVVKNKGVRVDDASQLRWQWEEKALVLIVHCERNAEMVST